MIVALHSAMNLWCEVFAVDDTALGGWLANGARFTTVAIAILLTIFKDRFWKAVPVADESPRDEKKRSIGTPGDLAIGMWAVVADFYDFLPRRNMVTAIGNATDRAM